VTMSGSSAAGGSPTKASGPRPHRCNDRVEDLLEVRSVPWQVLSVDFVLVLSGKSTWSLVLLVNWWSVDLQAILTLDFSGKIMPAWRVLRLCLKSDPG
jgi:hypothetical protein